MERTTVMADEQTLEKLRRLAQERGQSFAEVVRQALDAKAQEFRPKPKSLGIASSGPSNIAATQATDRVPPRTWR